MNQIRIIQPGILTTIQDLGRYGFQQYGVPISGAMDSYSLKLANILVGNDINEACLEITMIGPSIEFNHNTAIAITGANITPKVNGNKVNMYETIYVKPGDILTFGELISGFRTYLSILGGFDVRVIMGSKSTYTRGNIGGYKGRKLAKEDIIKVNAVNKIVAKRKIPDYLIPKYSQEETIRVILGPEDASFTDDGIKTFLNSEFIVSDNFDRMGYKLNGPKIEHKSKADIISTGISIGTIQVPGNGQPIVMLSDKQTTGGYTRIANVITTDISKFGQMKSGDKIKFEKIELKDAQALLLKQQKDLNELIELFNQVENGRLKHYLVTVNNKEYNVIIEEC